MRCIAGVAGACLLSLLLGGSTAGAWPDGAAWTSAPSGSARGSASGRVRQEPPSAGAAGDFDGVWHEAEHSVRYGASLVFDSRRRRVIQFGGQGPDAFGRASLWVFDPGAEARWKPLLAVGEAPAPRFAAAAVYDSLNDRIVIFGGRATPGPRLPSATVNDLWELRLGGLPRWHRLEATGPVPSPREHPGVALDERRRRMVLIGGARRVGCSIACDPHAYMNDVWAFHLDGAPRWEQLALAGEAPAPAAGFGAAYDSRRDAIVVMGGLRFGGFLTSSTSYEDVWQLSLGEAPGWSRLGPEQLREGPPTGFYTWPTLVYDRVRDRIVVFSGRDSVTKAFRPGASDPWKRLGAEGHGPNMRFDHSMVLDPVSEEIYLTGGYKGEPVWRLSLEEGATWRLEDTTGPTPAVEFGAAMASDPNRGRTILSGGIFRTTISGGDRQIPSDEVWTFTLDDERWEKLEGVRIPRGGLTGHRAVIDPRRDRLLLVGGSAPGVLPYNLIPNSYLYSLSLSGPPTWSEVFLGDWPPDLPPTLSVVLDPIRDRLLLQAGGLPGLTSTTLWALALSGEARFESLNVAGQRPRSAYGRAAVFDPVRDRLLVEMDSTRFHAPELAPLWELRLNEPVTWSQLSPGGPSPLPRIRQFSGYDPAADRVVTFGGSWLVDARGYDPASGTWAILLGGEPIRDSLEVQGPPPMPRSETAAALDPRTRKLVATRGSLGGLDTYVLDFERPVRRVDVVASQGRGLLHASPRSRGERAVTILSEPAFDARRLDVSSLRLEGAPVVRIHERWKTRVADRNADGLPDLECTFSLRDASEADAGPPAVLTGTDPEGFPLRGEVRVRAASGGDANVDVARLLPLEAEFALQGVTPNPSPGGTLRVSLSLATREPATLELVDVAGRRLERRDVSGAPGVRSVDLDPGPRRPPGLYWLILRQGARTASARAVIVR